MADYTSDDFVLVSPNDQLDSLGRLAISPHAWDLSCSISEGLPSVTKSFIFRVKDDVDNRKICPSLIRFNPAFPKIGSRLPEDPTLVYHGNGNLEHLDQDSRLWVYKAEYTITNSSDDDYDENTKPWDMPPTEVVFSYPEETVAFFAAYNGNNNRFHTDDNGTKHILVPVCNSAGDFFEAETIRRYKQMQFTYCLRESVFDIKTGFKFINTINKRDIVVCGIPIKKNTGLIADISPVLHMEALGNSRTKTKWWEISVTIRMDPYGEHFERLIVDAGTRAKNDVIDVSAVGIVTRDSTKVGKKSETIFMWHDWNNVAGQVAGAIQTGNVSVMYEAKKRYDLYLRNNPETTQGWPREFAYEKDVKMPLKKNGTVDMNAINDGDSAASHMPRTLSFAEYKTVAWAGLNLPEGAVKSYRTFYNIQQQFQTIG